MAQIRTPWRAVSAMFIICGAMIGIWASRIPAFAEAHNLTPMVLGWMLLCMGGGAILSFSLAGVLSEHLGASKATLLSYAASFFAFILLPMASNIWAFALAMALYGAVHGIMDVCMNAWAAEVERHMGKPVMSSFHAMFSLGAGLGAFSGYLAVKYHIAPLPHFVIGALMVTVVFAPFGLIDWASPKRQGPRGPIFYFPKGRLLLVGLFALSASVGEGAMGDWSAIFLNTAKGATEARAALGYSAFSVAMVAMRLAGFVSISRLGPVWSARISGAAAILGMATVISAGTVAVAIAGFGLMGFAYALIVPLAFSRAALEPGISTGRAIAGVATLSYGGMLVGPPLIGFVADAFSLEFAFGMIMLLGFLTVGLAHNLRAPT